MRKLHPDGICQCCGAVGPTWTTADAELADPLCDRCELAQARWEDWQWHRSHPGSPYLFAEPPPKTPPIRRPAHAD